MEGPPRARQWQAGPADLLESSAKGNFRQCLGYVVHCGGPRGSLGQAGGRAAGCWTLVGWAVEIGPRGKERGV